MWILMSFLEFVLCHGVYLRDQDICEEEKYLQEAIKNIIFQHIDPEKPLLISSSSAEEDLLSIVLKEVNSASDWQIHVYRQFVETEDVLYEQFFKVGSCIILTNGLEDLSDQLEELKASISWNGRARFLIVVRKSMKNPESFAQSLMRYLWEEAKIVDIVTLILCRKMFNIFTHFSYKSNEECTVAEKVILQEHWHMNCVGCFPNGKEIFPSKISSNLHGCMLNISTSELIPNVVGQGKDNYTGLEIDLLRIIQKSLNFTINFRTPKPGIMYETHYEMLEDLHLGLSDAVIGTFPLHLFIMQFADPTTTYLDNIIKWFLPCAEQNPRMKKVSEIFTGSTWLALLVVFIISSVSTWWIAKNSQELSSYKHFSNAFCNLYSAAVGVSIPQMPKTNKLRFLVILMIWYYFAINTIFQSFFTSVLVDPGYGKQILTFEELQESGLLYGSYSDIELLLNASSTYVSKIKLKKTPCEEIAVCIERILTKRDVAVMNIPGAVEYLALDKLGTGIELKICSLPENVYKMSFAIYVAKGSPLRDMFNSVIRHVLEAGVMDKLWLDIQYDLRLRNRNDESEEETFFVLGMSHLNIIFTMLIIGYLLGLITLILELSHSSFQKILRRKNKK
ncbi:hypothetical protein L9F63_023154 [Diploptera punctata]|uniref:Uncharacterized protein n=1 Tax=Diploptera punctata TaxID=6984 RepID=A0AAD8E9J1_DIPPU|nr:hypothetical protein L9F63_023154 [Diploptera punctata]